MRFLKFIISISLLPAAFGITEIFGRIFLETFPSCLFFLLGILSYTLVYPVFKRPLTTYILSHELTHVLWIWFFRGRIHGIRVGRGGGVVLASRKNMWINLAPYFFPLYTILVLFLWLVLGILWDLSKYYDVMIFVLGITWAFHLWMTLHILKQNQPDIREHGVVFSMVIIYMANLLVLTSMIVFISHRAGLEPAPAFRNFLFSSLEKIRGNYLWLARKIL